MRLQIDNAVSNLGKVAMVGRRLAENIHGNRQQQLEDPMERESLIASVAEVCFELMAQLRDDTPTPTTPGTRKADMVHEVSLLVKELKTWSEENEEEGGVNGEASLLPPRAPRLMLQEGSGSRLLEWTGGGGGGGSDAGGSSARSNTGERGQARNAPLPEEWRSAVDEASGRTFYYHKKHRVPQWHRPPPEAPPSPPPSPPPPSPPPSPPPPRFIITVLPPCDAV